jgi:hypothetical protein
LTGYKAHVYLGEGNERRMEETEVPWRGRLSGENAAVIAKHAFSVGTQRLHLLD